MKIKKLTLALIIILTTTICNAQEQKIWQGDLLTKNLDAFHSGKYTEVKGTITIENYEGQDLNLLGTLQKCTGNINIINNKKLEFLKGLENLQFVGGRFSIIENPELYNYCALQKTLLTEGIKGVEISKGILEKMETEDNGYNPSLMNLQNKDCAGFKFREFCFQC